MSEEATFDQAAVDIFNIRGQSATFTPLVGDPVGCKVDVVTGVDLQPVGESQVWEQGITLEYLLAVVGKEADPGDTFLTLVGATTYTVKAVEENDGRFVKVVVT